ncbi:MAG TPA: hypothetical protein VGR50_04915 [Terriglobales bacterium]|nr:hypothetical protein [Terriglobales bacterium]
MQATGEIIRMMNYVDDIAATLRRITANMGSMSDEEKKRLADYMRKSDPNYIKVLEQLEKAQLEKAPPEKAR